MITAKQLSICDCEYAWMCSYFSLIMKSDFISAAGQKCAGD